MSDPDDLGLDEAPWIDDVGVRRRDADPDQRLRHHPQILHGGVISKYLSPSPFWFTIV